MTKKVESGGGGGGATGPRAPSPGASASLADKYAALQQQYRWVVKECHVGL